MMIKNYKVTVNGKSYDVSVEEIRNESVASKEMSLLLQIKFYLLLLIML